MNYFLETNSAAISLRQRTSEYTSKHVCSFTAANALAAIVACEALNSNCLSQTLATQEMEQPGTQDWLALRDQEDKAANSEFRAEYGSDDDDMKPSDHGHCDHCNNELPTGAQHYCSPQCIADASEAYCNPTECEHCKGEVTDGQSFCSQRCCDASMDHQYEYSDETVDEVEPLVHNCMQCGTLISQGADYCTSECAEANGAEPSMVTLLERAFGSNVTDRSIAASARLDEMRRQWAA